jgi:hypothetical protein
MGNETFMASIEQTTRTAILTTASVEILAGFILIAAGMGIYYYKLKGAKEMQTLIWIIAVVVTLLGLTLFVVGAFALVNYLTAPIIIGS